MTVEKRVDEFIETEGVSEELEDEYCQEINYEHYQRNRFNER